MSRFFELFALILVSILTVSSKRLSFLERGLDSTRVIGGSSCSTDDFPFLVLVGQSIDRYVVKQMCAGTLLTGYLVLTAAHCVSDMLVVVAGQSTNPVLRNVQEQYVHIDFDPSTLDNDIAILKLFVPIEANEYITYVQLPEPSRNINLVKTCHYSIVMGWGTTDPFMYRKPAGLQCVILPVIQNSFCRSLYKGKSISIDDNLICTFSSKKEDACQGDSGGPLVCGEIQEGIISKGLGCAGAYPGIYTRVDRYLDFITQVIAEHNNSNLLTALRPDLMFALLLSLFLS